jgi:hypothetical protein
MYKVNCLSRMCDQHGSGIIKVLGPYTGSTSMIHIQQEYLSWFYGFNISFDPNLLKNLSYCGASGCGNKIEHDFNTLEEFYNVSYLPQELSEIQEEFDGDPQSLFKSRRTGRWADDDGNKIICGNEQQGICEIFIYISASDDCPKCSANNNCLDYPRSGYMIQELYPAGSGSLNNYDGGVVIRWLKHSQCGNCWLGQLEDNNLSDGGITSKWNLEMAYNARHPENATGGKKSTAAAAGGMHQDLYAVLVELRLERFVSALVEAGYEDISCFDFAHISVEDLIDELIEAVEAMKKPLVRKLLRHLESIAVNLLPVAAPDPTGEQDDSLVLPVASAVPVNGMVQAPAQDWAAQPDASASGYLGKSGW